MNLWNAVNEVLNEYYKTFEGIDIDSDRPDNPLKEIIDKASRDSSFRDKLISSPVDTLAREGFKLPAGFNVKVVEETDTTIYIPIGSYIGT